MIPEISARLGPQRKVILPLEMYYSDCVSELVGAQAYRQEDALLGPRLHPSWLQAVFHGEKVLVMTIWYSVQN